MKKLTLMALLGGCTLAIAMQSAWAFYDPNLTASGHPAEAQQKAAGASQISDVLSYLNKSGYTVQGLTSSADGNYNAQVIGPDGKVRNIQFIPKQKQMLDEQGQPLPALMPVDAAMAWLKQMGYTAQTFQLKDGKYVFAANDKSGQAETVTIDPATKNLSVVAAG